ncbi:MAG: FAD-binding oxidoreductase [Solirubrobacterales bacterium]|nr:FAD-binding oxidoreductase [Solirubrobacterales bacterium]
MPTPTDTVPLWLDDGAYAPRPPLAEDLRADVCVVGGGVAGLACARRLATHGLRAVVLEARTVAGGASGRNGGFLLAGAAAFHVDARERFGRDAARSLYARTLRAQDEVYALAGELGVAAAVRRTGSLRVATSEDEAEHVRRHVAALAEDGFPGELVGPDDLPPVLRRSGLLAAHTAHDGALQPAVWVRALARAAEAAGVRLFEGTPVPAPVPAPGEGPVAAAGGSVRAAHVVVAADGALPALVPEVAGAVRARRLHMLATAPLPERVLEQPSYLRYGHEYVQQTADGRIAAGGFSDLDAGASWTDREAGAPAVWARVERWLRDDLGVAAPVTHRWVGVVGYASDGLPRAGDVHGRPGLHALGGYSGTGNLVGFLAGQALADRIALGEHDGLSVFASP